MHLTITGLANKPTDFIAEILQTISSCQCNVIELRSTNLAQTIACYLLVEGEWNHIAKLENLLDVLQNNLEIQVQTLRPKTNTSKDQGIPYSLETISVDRNKIIEHVTSFIQDRDICIEEVSASCYQAAYIQTPIFSTKFILIIPSETRLLSFREEFLDFCDNFNIDAIIEPIKR